MTARPILIAALLLPSSAFAATLTVGPGGTFANIGGALGNANDGDVIEVEAGNYNGSLFIDVDVTIVGVGGSGAVTIQAGNSEVLEIWAADVVLEGLTIEGNAQHGLFVHGGSFVEASDVHVVGFDSGTDGAGILMEDASLLLIDSVVANNYSDDDGAGIDLDNSLLIADNTEFANNIAWDNGGAIRSTNSEVDVDGSFFNGNEAADGGAIQLSGGTLTVVNALFRNNAADATGGAILGSNGTEITVSDTTLHSNTADWGGAIYSRSFMWISGAVFQENEAYQTGGAVRWSADGFGTSELVIEASTFLDNISADIGGGVAASSSGSVRGNIELYDSTFTRNIAARGGGLSTSTNSTILAQRNTFCSNSGANSSGGVRVLDSAFNGQVWTNNVFVENVSANFGGGMFISNSGDAEIINNTFLGNDAPDGGNLYSEFANVALLNNIMAFSPNGNGYVSDTNAGQRNHNLWWSNSASDVGGALSASDLGANSVFADPMLTLYQADGLCGNDAFSPAAGSPAIDAGAPGVLDLDGSPRDIGAYGGPSADPGILIDDDGDGFNAASDCDDGDAAVFPGASEVCDGVDNDCDGDIDGALAPGATDWFPDVDEDGFGSDADIVTACDAPPGYIGTGGDCADRDADINPSAAEVCDDIDNDCDDIVDDGLTTTYYFDGDADGYGDPGITVDRCDGAPPNTSTDGGDCNDNDADINPGMEELCDGIDNDCNGDADTELFTTWYRDADADLFGNDEITKDGCTEPQGFVANGGDCNDENPNVHPDAIDDSVDTIDQDCDDSDGQPFASEKLLPASECGCSATNSGGMGWWAVLGAAGLLLRRRRS